MKKRKTTAVKLLIERGAFSNESEAEPWILSGQVLIGNQLIKSKGQSVEIDAPIRIRTYNKQYVGRGGVKLAHALSVFDIEVSGRVALDTGASAGGFTDCLLKRGATRVYAVEAGVGQLHSRLRHDARVVNLENTNIGEASLKAIMNPPPTLASVDIGYLSLRKAIPIIASLMGDEAEIVCLVKPLFEIDDALTRRTGEITHEAYAPVLVELTEWLSAEGYNIAGVTYSPILGSRGTHEFFLRILPGQDTEPFQLKTAITEAVERVLLVPAQPEDEDGYF